MQLKNQKHTLYSLKNGDTKSVSSKICFLIVKEQGAAIPASELVAQYLQVFHKTHGYTDS
jgi:hypothetical protein